MKTIKKNSANIRIWHWLNSIIITGSLLTVLLNSTIFDKRENTNFISNELKNAGASVTSQQAKAVAHGLEDKIWDLHVYLGYFLIALFIYRLGIEIFQRADQKVAFKIKRAFQLYTKNTDSASNRKDLAIKAIYLLFYVLLLVMVLTGLSIKFNQEIGISKSFSHSLKEIHSFTMYIIISFIVLHIVGVILAERKEQKGILSDMINGGETNE